MLDEFGAKESYRYSIAELGFTGIAVGSGMVVVLVEYMTFNFCLVGIDQINNYALRCDK
jgi:pyruvate dehydrogenase E1 component beta subunit